MSDQLARGDLTNCLFEPEDLVELRAFSGTRGQGGLGIVLPAHELVQSGTPWIKQAWTLARSLARWPRLGSMRGLSCPRGWTSARALLLGIGGGA